MFARVLLQLWDAGKKKKRLRRLSIRPSGVWSAVASNTFFFLRFFSISQGFYHDPGYPQGQLLQGYCHGLLQPGPSPEEAVPIQCSLAAESMNTTGGSREGDKGPRETGREERQVVKAVRAAWARKLTAISRPWCGLCSSLAPPSELQG